MPEVLRSRVPLVIAVVVLVAVAAVLVQRGQARQATSPFDTAAGERPLLMAEAAEDYYEIDVFVGDVCAPGAEDVEIRDVELFGVAGALTVTGFSPDVITARCDSTEPDELVVQVQRESGESAHADGVTVTYEIGGTLERVGLPVSMTLCRQLSEC